MLRLCVGLMALSCSLIAQADVLQKIDTIEVTNKAYAEFITAHPEHKLPKYWKEYRSAFFINSVASKLSPFNENTFKKPDHPVVGVSWYSAKAYCKWRGQTLPTHAQWMKYAGVSDGRIWPWGNQWDYKKANTGGEKWAENDAYTYSAPSKSFEKGASPYNILNMAGNVAEWVEEKRVVGGSSNSSPSGVSIKSYVERDAEYRSFDIGFRCIK
ncbi:MAG: formylglycine-generating enzyme family protein [Gammaproteobacteria bacterium]|nr:formylglycine-generating enzyme family protein [Gammaproteobacteria bacterium]